MITKNDILNILIDNNFKTNDTILIHSSLKSIGEIDGGAETLIDALKEYFYDGLIIFPTHTWSFMNSDDQTLDLVDANSCVGALTNIALTKGFKRSFHPTHSVCAYGKLSEDYLSHDDNAKTPVSPSGCFGILHELNAKILFIGAPLSKNTFIHSIEERFNVPDRFTNKIYHFYSTDGTITKEFYMPKHYSSLNPHISNNYLKLENPLHTLGISANFKLGDAKCIVIDSKKCFKFVSYILENNLHIFDDDKEIDSSLIDGYRALN